MNTQKTLSKTIEALTAIKAGDVLRARDLMETVSELIRDDIRSTEAKKTGKTSAVNAAKRVLKAAQKTPRVALHKAFYNDGLQCICDGFRGVQFKNALPLDELGDDVEPINFASLIDNAKQNNDIILDLPELKALKTYIKLCKAENKNAAYTYDFGPGLPLVNAEFLADLLELLPGCKAYTRQNKTSVAPLYFECDAGRGILCPVRPKEDQERQKTKL